MRKPAVMILFLSVGLGLALRAGPTSRDGVYPGDREKVIAVMGSSVAAGWVTSREKNQDMQNGYAFRLARWLAPRGFQVVNISVPGDTTQKVLARLEKDLFPLKPDFAVIALSLENEGIRGLGGKDPDQVFRVFRDNLREIIARCRARAIQPVLGSVYANDNFTAASHYQYVTAMNMEIASWDVPSINFLGALDRGDGRFVEGVTFDLDHPDDSGHRELFHSIVPGLFEVLAEGKPLPVRDLREGAVRLGDADGTAFLSYVPDDPYRSYSLIVNVRPSRPGVLAAVRGLEGKVRELAVREDGFLEYRDGVGFVHPLKASLLDKAWHQVGMSHHFLKKEIRVFVDGALAGTVADALVPVQFVLGGPGGGADGNSAAEGDYNDCQVYRSVLNPAEMASLETGRLNQSSLEVYAPLRGETPVQDRPIVNLAQSPARVFFSPSNTEREIEQLKAAVQRENADEKVHRDPAEREPLILAPEILDRWTGLYEIAPGLTLTVERDGGRLFALINGGEGGKTELFALSEDRFFVRSVGQNMEIIFHAGKGGPADRLTLKVDGREMTGTRKGVLDSPLAWLYPFAL
jgi:lysophospholipase L1-like esterase